jgi:lysine N6-hydroxylase
VPHFFCAGVGIGPANLSLAALLFGRPGMSNIFFDKKERFSWHDGQQMDGATLQVSILKDLVSLSDPTNPFSFLHYLHSQGRIYHFINAQFEAVPRQEFRNYFEWASRRNPNLCFGEEVQAVEFDNVFKVHTRCRTVTADNICVGVGTVPWVPPQAGTFGDRAFHVSDFASRAADLGGLRVGVVGGGQSGAEAFLDLISRPANELPRRVSWISRRPNFLPLDDSPFTNDYFMPDHSDYFASLPAPVRAEFNMRHLLTSDGISESTLVAIYQRMYVHRFLNDAADLMALYPNREVTEVTGDDTAGYRLTLVHNYRFEAPQQVDLDAVIWATGYRTAAMKFLDPIARRLVRQEGEFKIDSSFAACWDGPPENHIFFQNAARQQRGLPDPNLSLLAWRSQRIFDRMTGNDTVPQSGSFIEWASRPPAAPAKEPINRPSTPLFDGDIVPGRHVPARHITAT